MCDSAVPFDDDCTLIADSKIVHRWVLTCASMPSLQKVLAVALIENYLIEGVKSQMVLRPGNEITDHELKQQIKESSRRIQPLHRKR